MLTPQMASIALIATIVSQSEAGMVREAESAVSTFPAMREAGYSPFCLTLSPSTNSQPETKFIEEYPASLGNPYEVTLAIRCWRKGK